MSHFLVTGGAGFIGANFVRHVLGHTDHSVTVLDKLTYAGTLESLSGLYSSRFSFVQGDIADARVYAAALSRAGFGAVTTEIRPAAEAGPFYLAESHHQQYLHKVPGGYCPVHSTGVACPVPEEA